jgi:hydrogenase maturation factor
MPTKLPSYLISGSPILVIGSTQTAQVKYADKYKFAHIVNEDSIQNIMNSIKLLISNADYSTNLVKNAYKTASKNHDQKIVRKEFQNLFINSFNI